ncbi:hypothetical protein K5X82_03970 [Halosquirtibacter xylanolyticus]|uniref:hypothetical protein n=1 Tax=Halosquirtibacter xylanolyticus TaxID=3374599 RepID=UPI003749F893|nr:hypothetical protein K5X82_03970 [Prolixibacteraceae bacterium]
MKNFILLLIAITALYSCSKDNDVATSETSKGNILLSTRIANSDGTSGSAYMQLINKITPRTINNKRALPTSYSVPPIIIGKEIYQIPGFSMQNDLIIRHKLDGNQLIEDMTTVLPAKSGAVSLVKHDNKIYISMNYLGKILILDHSTLKKIGDIDLSIYGVGDQNPDPGIMVIRDGLLFVGLNQLVGGYTPTKERAESDVLIVDTKTDKIIKKITNRTAQFSMPTKPEADEKSIFIDENNDIYINCISGFGGLGHKSGFLRIKSGETEFDKNYTFDITSTPVKNGKYNPSYLIHIDYFKDGELYATGNVNEYYSPTPSYTKDKTVVSYKINLRNKTIEKLDLPRSNNYGASVNIVDHQVLFGLSTETGNGFYSYDIKIGKVSDSPIINTEGYPEAISRIQ